jgi:hypothetical protein
MTMREVKNSWWRWPLVPFASILAAGLGSVVANIALLLCLRLLGGGQPDGFGFLYVLPAVSYGIFGYITSLVSYSLSPSHKLMAAVVMSFLMLAVLALALFATFSANTQVGLFTHLVIGTVSAAIFSVVALFQSHRGVLEPGTTRAGP